MTFAADEECLDRVKREIRSVVEEASAASMACEDPDGVMVLAIQSVPTEGAPEVTELDGAK
ncbi:MAG: hypothetical protein ACI9MC_000732 [Kiritimatiellia bacterium]|jgi:hypothetical protein